ncbi:MAG: ABC transporter permease [Desulfonauticus sp.]|nr:ABC transporter permease [Desulfonauticus sp.]
MDTTILLASVISSAAPIIFATLGETFTERAGIVNLSLDGTILLSAMVGFVVAYNTHNLILAFLASGLTGAAVASIVAIGSLFYGLSQVAIGFVLTLTCRDLAYFLGNAYTRLPGPQVKHLAIPLLKDLPFIGPVFFNHNLVVYLSYVLIIFSWYYFYKTKAGLILRACGENPVAAYSRGINVKLHQLAYTLWGGFWVGLSGASYSLLFKPGWGRPQGAEGIGWIALAIVIFGGWDPLKVALGTYFFAFLQLVGILLQSSYPQIPSQVFQVAPFPLMILMLVIMHISSQKTAKLDPQPQHLSPIQRLLRFLKTTPPAALGSNVHTKEF